MPQHFRPTTESDCRAPDRCFESATRSTPVLPYECCLARSPSGLKQRFGSRPRFDLIQYWFRMPSTRSDVKSLSELVDQQVAATVTRIARSEIDQTSWPSKASTPKQLYQRRYRGCRAARPSSVGNRCPAQRRSRPKPARFPKRFPGNPTSESPKSESAPGHSVVADVPDRCLKDILVLLQHWTSIQFGRSNEPR